MPGRWKAASFFISALLALVATACGGDSGDVALSWQTEDGKPLQVRIADPGASYDTVIYVDNASGETIEDAVLRFRPATSQSAPVGFSVGTVTNLRTDFDGDVHLWRLGDIAPNTRVVFLLGLWFSVALQVESAAPVEFVVELQSADLPAALSSNALTVRFQK